MRRPEGDKSGHELNEGKKAGLAELTAQVQGALGLVDGEAADALIASAGTGGEESDEYRALIRAANAVTTMNWMAMKANGVRENPATLRMSAQTQMIVLDLVHKSYALGIKRGREERDG